MAKQSKPVIQKLKDAILNDLTPEDQIELGAWFSQILEVREADAAAARRREATKQETGKTTIVGGSASGHGGSGL